MNTTLARLAGGATVTALLLCAGLGTASAATVAGHTGADDGRHHSSAALTAEARPEPLYSRNIQLVDQTPYDFTLTSVSGDNEGASPIGTTMIKDSAPYPSFEVTFHFAAINLVTTTWDVRDPRTNTKEGTAVVNMTVNAGGETDASGEIVLDNGTARPMNVAGAINGIAILS